MPYKNAAKQRNYQKEWMRKRRSEWLVHNGPCVQCGSSKDLQIDHTDSAEKVSHRIWSWTSSRREAELKKCQVLCRLCHKKKTLIDQGVDMDHGSKYRYGRGCRCIACKEWNKKSWAKYATKVNAQRRKKRRLRSV